MLLERQMWDTIRFVSRSLIYRVVAVAFLLLIGVELFACEVIAPERCESFGFPKENSSQPGDGNCLCCCRHVVVLTPVIVDARATVITTVNPADPTVVEGPPVLIYHPPRV